MKFYDGTLSSILPWLVILSGAVVGTTCLTFLFLKALMDVDESPEEDPAPKAREIRRKLAVGDRVRYYGTFNEYVEVSRATILEISGDAVLVSMDRVCVDGGAMRGGPIQQYAHRKQLRKLKKGPKAGSQSDQ